jgi:MiaB/RimO family radical SAM methylthiotransferase
LIKYKVYVTTNGCERARISSARVEQFFRVNNSSVVRDSTQADIVIFFACGLSKETESDSLIVIKKLKGRIKPSTRLFVWGCLPKIDTRSLARAYDGPTIGPLDVGYFEKILETAKIPFDDISVNAIASKKYSRNPSLARCMLFLLDGFLGYTKKDLWESRSLSRPVYWISVSTGCIDHCTYCSDRCAWGRVRSRPIHRIISEFKRGLKTGYDRFFLISSDLGAYGKDIGSTLPELLEEMVKTDTGRNYKIFMNHINPHHLKHLYHDLEDIFESGRIGVLGSQIQSGSNRILKLMGRRYTAEDWKEYMQRIHIRFPNIFLSTHFMVGYPTETDEDFKMTLKLIDQVFLDDAFIFKFSQRQNVPASRLPEQVSPKIVRKRYNTLRIKAGLNILRRKTQRLFS